MPRLLEGAKEQNRSELEEMMYEDFARNISMGNEPDDLDKYIKRTRYESSVCFSFYIHYLHLLSMEAIIVLAYLSKEDLHKPLTHLLVRKRLVYRQHEDEMSYNVNLLLDSLHKAIKELKALKLIDCLRSSNVLFWEIKTENLYEFTAFAEAIYNSSNMASTEHQNNAQLFFKMNSPIVSRFEHLILEKPCPRPLESVHDNDKEWSFCNEE